MNQKLARSGVRFLDGVFYAQDWTEVYVPLSNRDAMHFQSVVSAFERSIGRLATKTELARLAEEFWMERETA